MFIGLCFLFEVSVIVLQLAAISSVLQCHSSVLWLQHIIMLLITSQAVHTHLTHFIPDS